MKKSIIDVEVAREASVLRGARIRCTHVPQQKGINPLSYTEGNINRSQRDSFGGQTTTKTDSEQQRNTKTRSTLFGTHTNEAKKRATKKKKQNKTKQ